MFLTIIKAVKYVIFFNQNHTFSFLIYFWTFTITNTVHVYNVSWQLYLLKHKKLSWELNVTFKVFKLNSPLYYSANLLFRRFVVHIALKSENTTSCCPDHRLWNLFVRQYTDTVVILQLNKFFCLLSSGLKLLSKYFVHIL